MTYFVNPLHCTPYNLKNNRILIVYMLTGFTRIFYGFFGYYLDIGVILLEKGSVYRPDLVKYSRRS